MPRLLGHPSGALEKAQNLLLTAGRISQVLGRSVKGALAARRAGTSAGGGRMPKAGKHVERQSAAVTPPPLTSQSQLRDIKSTAKVATSSTSRSQSEATVLLALDGAAIIDLNERAMFMAQMSHESNGFTRLTENLNYKPARLLAIFPAKFESLEDAQAVVGLGQAAIAERIYGNRKALGNTHTGDGYRYRGRGIVQLTGRTNYQLAGKAIGVDLEATPDKAAELDVAIRIAIWFWQAHAIAEPARQGDVKKVTRLINGGTIGLADREAEYAAWRSRLSAVSSQSSPRLGGERLP